MFVHENFWIFRIGWRNFSDPHFWFPDHDLFVNVMCNNVRIGGSRLEVLYGMLHSNFKVYHLLGRLSILKYFRDLI